MLLNEKKWHETFQGIYQGDVKFNAPMKKYTGLSIGGPADILVFPDDPLSLRNIVTVLKKNGIPFSTVGKGTNLLVRDGGIEGVVISLKAFDRIETLKEGNQNVELFVEAGALLQRLIQFCKEKGFSGVEGLAGIPGTIGGAVCGNAGSYGYEIKDVLESVAIMDSAGRLDRFKAEGLGFRYRGSDILPEDIVLSANIRLRMEEKEKVISSTDSFSAEKKKTQPVSERSAGCVFKNPQGVSAGKLIDEAGCKGMRIGGIEVSSVHANFFINKGEGTAAEFLDLMDKVSSVVNERSGIALEPEIKVIGRG